MELDRLHKILDIVWVASLGVVYVSVYYFFYYLLTCFILGYGILAALYCTYASLGDKPTTTTTCSICIEEVEEKAFEWCLQCKQTFHLACANEWHEHGSFCPNCRMWLGLVRDTEWPFRDIPSNIKIGSVIGVTIGVLPYLTAILLPLRFMLRTPRNMIVSTNA